MSLGKSIRDFFNPIGNFATNLLSDFTGIDTDRAVKGVSDTLFGTTYGQEHLNQQAQAFNAAQAQISRDWQEMMYNNYQSPQALMQQFRDAGLNPALMYGSSTPSPSFSDSSASIGAGSAAHGNVSLSDALIGAQIRNIDANTDLQKGQTKATEIRNKVDSMNASAFEQFFNMNEQDIIRSMQQQLGIQYNDFVLSNYETMQAAWDFSILFGLSYSDALTSGQFLYQDSWSDELEKFFDNMDNNPNYQKAKQLFIGGYDAEIATNAAIRVVNQALEQKEKKNLDIWTFLNEKAQRGDKWERVGAQIALTALFISEQNFHIPMPNVRFMNFKRNHSTTNNYNGTFNNSYNSHSKNAIYN